MRKRTNKKHRGKRHSAKQRELKRLLEFWRVQQRARALFGNRTPLAPQAGWISVVGGGAIESNRRRH